MLQATRDEVNPPRRADRILPLYPSRIEPMTADRGISYRASAAGNRLIQYAARRRIAAAMVSALGMFACSRTCENGQWVSG